jgi:NTE family protein
VTGVRINLALQGGGAHGAFTWGVLDRILEDDGIEIAAISGTSAGALNGAALKAGLAAGSREKARENLDWLWGQVGAQGDLRLTTWMTAFGPGPAHVSRALEYSVGWSVLDAVQRAVSPYAYGPFYQNPLERIARRFRYDEVCCDAGPSFFVCATNVRTGRIRVFEQAEVTTEVILASACLPTIFQAVEIDGEAYWDGGYTGNPALYPLFAPGLPDDIVIVNINPLERPGVPRSPQEIQNRINEIGFNTSLLRELRAISFVKRLIAQGGIPRGAMKDVAVHMIADDELMSSLSVATKVVPSPIVLRALRDAGRAAADRFLADHGADLGRGGTVDLVAMFS